MKTLFINISLRPDAKRKLLPVGIAYIMTAAQKAGFDFDFIDMDGHDLSLLDLEKIIRKTSYDVYAFGCIVTGFRIVRQLSDMIKEANPQAVIVAGNSVATSIHELLLTRTRVDIAVMGEGDITIVNILKALEGKKGLDTVKGIAFKSGDRIVRTEDQPLIKNLDDFGYPDWNLFDLEKYAQRDQYNSNATQFDGLVQFPVSAARGCPFSCTFCYHVFKGKKYRRYSDSCVIKEIAHLNNAYGANFISFWDELTFPNIATVENHVKAIGGLDFKIGWDAPCRAGLFRKEHVPLIRDIKASGCDNLSFSLENASPDILKAMNKHITVSQFIEQANALWKGGVAPLTSVVLGYPQETPETIRMTLEVCEQCNIFPSVGFLLPLPGTPIYEWARENGHIKDEAAYLERIGDRQDFHINLTRMEDQEFVDIVQQGLEKLAQRLGIKVDSVFKTTTYQKPKTRKKNAA